MPLDFLRFVIEKETERLHGFLREYFRIAPEDFAVFFEKIKERSDPLTPMEYLLSMGCTEKEAAYILSKIISIND
ncbi:MAG: hypothetical protein A2942_03200 [Candidatus Lloydbacteria bacterium RIFCSPLOWO2_01_FULL_50_20]|uniref:Uncharacterized protein n=1 Tax=Candidatus Lloydbacteria bacterium RIFCSPLOWO2_01_FULL_50_20 TaxID=1798665 RepID=A0A1G2DFM2_9BACT|nr:MAG: hypothetical protein A3C13_01540 [Candidatus Lloydbacteria bacterium RIFCSPHIGHO2_02_FULL_50_11]OGZ11598.1 MAG: hypothetical protein A2942_03200 [Candidatus Lloydbacteria bacterium RIFCSPLOWO2_01_FULL_50_20]